MVLSSTSSIAMSEEEALLSCAFPLRVCARVVLLIPLVGCVSFGGILCGNCDREAGNVLLVRTSAHNASVVCGLVAGGLETRGERGCEGIVFGATSSSGVGCRDAELPVVSHRGLRRLDCGTIVDHGLTVAPRLMPAYCILRQELSDNEQVVTKVNWL